MRIMILLRLLLYCCYTTDAYANAEVDATAAAATSATTSATVDDDAAAVAADDNDIAPASS